MAKKNPSFSPRASRKTAMQPQGTGLTLDPNFNPTQARKAAAHDARKLGLQRGDLPNSIKEVIATLTQAGFEAYIVGGGVRDSLLGLVPKDFDAVTDATPAQIKEVFGKRCRIIGRRFLLCHVYSGRDMIEVATFRAPPSDSNHTTQDGMIVRDNVWGNIFQDVVRRDFSINALYYQPLDGVVYDFCGGLADVEAGVLRLLGDTQKRIEEDPVRLLRALRFKAKLGFDFDAALERQFSSQNWALLAQVSPHRLYDETQKMFTGGYLRALLPLLFDYGALAQLLFYPPTMLTPLVEQVMINTDKRIGGGKSINPAFFYAAILWENYLYLLEKYKKNSPFVEAQVQAANKVLDKQRPITAMPKFAEQFIKDIWLMQTRLANPRKKNLLKLFENPRFRAAFDFLLLREQVEARNRALAEQHGQAVTLDDESTNGMGHWWAWFQTLGSKQQMQAIDEFDINAVRTRFGNIVAHTLDHHTDAQANDPDKPNTNQGLSEQQQLEKDQLRQLSLADHDKPATPAEPLWQTQHADVWLDNVADDAADEFTTADDEPHSRANRSRRNRNTTTLANTGVPNKRRHRVPSSDLSVLERRRLATAQQAPTLQTLATAGVPESDLVDKTAITDSHSTTSSATEANTTETKTGTSIPPKTKRARKPKNEPADDHAVTESKPKTKPKRKAKTTAAKDAEQADSTDNEQPAKPKRARKPKPAPDSDASAAADDQPPRRRRRKTTETPTHD